jgi:hypothetical protein
VVDSVKRVAKIVCMRREKGGKRGGEDEELGIISPKGL